MSAELTTIIVSSIVAAVSAPLGAWVNSRVLRQKYQLELDKLRAEMKQTLTNVENSELENVRKASDILMENIVKPLEKEIKSLRKDVDKFRKAVEKIPSCPMAGDCPVARGHDLAVYDTDKPAADSTGLPSVKAVLHKEHRQKQQSRETAQAEIQTEAQVTADTAEDSTRQSDSVQTSEQKPSAGTGILRLGTGMFLLAVSVFAIWIFYKRIKR